MSECKNCSGVGWVCESHPNVAWDGDNECCGGPGMPCEWCNPSDENNAPKMPPGFEPIIDRDDGYTQ